MKAKLTSAVLLALLVVVSACLVNVNRAWSPGDVVNVTRLAGAWKVVKYGDLKDPRLPSAPWFFHNDTQFIDGNGVPAFVVDIVGEANRTARIEAVFFKLGELHYVESRPSKVPMNDLAQLHLLPMRVVSLVEEREGRLLFHAPNGKMINEHASIKKREIGDFLVVENDTAELRAFLLKHGKRAFLPEPLVVLARP